MSEDAQKKQSVKPGEGPATAKDHFARRANLRLTGPKYKLPYKPGPEQTKQEPTD